MLDALRASGTHCEAMALTAGMRQADARPNSRRDAASTATGARAATAAAAELAVASDQSARPTRMTLGAEGGRGRQAQQRSAGAAPGRVHCSVR
jgi:hypothetical protein